MNTLAPSLLALSLMTLSGGLAAADADAGRAKAAQVCAACHGANGISVGDAIPNLAGQKPRYLESQLAALKDGRRKHEVMNAIAAQLTPADRAAILDEIERLRLAARRMRADADELNAAADRNDRQADALAAMLEGRAP